MQVSRLPYHVDSFGQFITPQWPSHNPPSRFRIQNNVHPLSLWRYLVNAPSRFSPCSCSVNSNTLLSGKISFWCSTLTLLCVCVSSYLCSSQTGPGPGPVPGGSGGSLPVSPGDVLPLHHGEGHPGTCSRPHRPQRHAHGELVNPICLCF